MKIRTLVFLALVCTFVVSACSSKLGFTVLTLHPAIKQVRSGKGVESETSKHIRSRTTELFTNGVLFGTSVDEGASKKNLLSILVVRWKPLFNVRITYFAENCERMYGALNGNDDLFAQRLAVDHVRNLTFLNMLRKRKVLERVKSNEPQNKTAEASLADLPEAATALTPDVMHIPWYFAARDAVAPLLERYPDALSKDDPASQAYLLWREKAPLARWQEFLKTCNCM